MVSKLENGLSCMNYCCDVYELNSIVNSVGVDDWTASNDFHLIFDDIFVKIFLNNKKFKL